MTAESADDTLATDPVSGMELAAWALAAYIDTERAAGEHTLAAALTGDPYRTAVLQAAGLVSSDGVAHRSLHDGPAAVSAAAARSSSLRQAADAAAGNSGTGWAEQSDQVLLDQGRASAATGRALATNVVPLLGLSDRLAVPGSRVLDVGTGVGALAIALASELPAVHVTGIDVLDRAVCLAHLELEQASSVAGRVEFRLQGVEDLDDVQAFDLAWVPAPFLSDSSLAAGIPRVVDALRPGGWIVVGTNPVALSELAGAVARWQAKRNCGSAMDAEHMTQMLRDGGLHDVVSRPTVTGGPILVAGRR